MASCRLVVRESDPFGKDVRLWSLCVLPCLSIVDVVEAYVSLLCSRSDKPYHLGSVDLVRFNPQGKIAQMKEFLDNGYIQKYVE